MTEEWRDIEGYEGLYAVSSLGRIKRLAHWKNQRTDRASKYCNYKMLDEKIMSPSIAGPYTCVQLSRDRGIKTFTVHRLVAKAFIPNPNSLPEVNHKDCDGHNNSADNLEWCDRKYNINYANRTEKAMKAIEKKVQCIETGKVYDSGAKAAEALGLQKSKISLVCNGKRKTTGGFHWCFYQSTQLMQGGKK
jgi:hypothetical protein